MSPDLDDDAIGYHVVKHIDVNVVKQTIHLDVQENLVPVLERIAVLMRSGKFTGKQAIIWNQGGVKSIETEQELK